MDSISAHRQTVEYDTVKSNEGTLLPFFFFSKCHFWDNGITCFQMLFVHRLYCYCAVKYTLLSAMRHNRLVVKTIRR